MLTQDKLIQIRNFVILLAVLTLLFGIANNTHAKKAKRIETHVNDNVSLRLTGRFMHDFLVNSSVDANNESSNDWRRARLGIRAKLGDDWHVRLSGDFPDGELELRDLRVDYRAWPIHIAAGRIQEPFGLSETSNSNHLVLMERPLATAIGPDYSTGIQANTRGRNWGVSIGAFDSELAGLELTNSDRNNDKAITARGTWKAIRNDSVLLHLGASASRRKPKANRGVRFNTRPETILVSGSNISHPRILDTQEYTLTGLEFGLRHGPRLLQAEYFMADINRLTSSVSNNNPSFNGFYAQASWALTGERRRYRTRSGSFSGIVPKKELTHFDSKFWQTGAWEIAVRYSTLNLRDTDVDLDGDIDGEEGQTITLGLNWYPTGNSKIMLNTSRITEKNGRTTDSDTLIQMRAQFFF